MTRLDENMEKQGRLLSSILFQKQTQVEVVLNRTVLAWKRVEKSKKGSISSTSDTAPCHAVQVCDIVAVSKAEDEDNTESRKSQNKAEQLSQLYPHAFTVFYVRRMRQHQWRCSNVTFRLTSLGLCEQWIQVIKDQLSLFTNRPKNLLVYINPYGGKQRGKRIYEQKVAPLFRRASISADVIVTEWANHARDHLKTEANLDKYDGVVCVGGDGMFNEIMNGLVTRTQTDNGVDLNQPDADFVPCTLRIGIIPAGSTDCICFATVGTNDAVTSALHIIVGDSQNMDVCSVHHNNTFLRYSVSLLGYGFYGDLLSNSESNRWLGPARYDLSGVKTFLSHNYYEGTVSFLPAESNMGTPRDKQQCRSGCNICQHKLLSKNSKQWETSEKEKSDKDSDSDWSVIQGKFLAINAASMSCACPRSPQGLSPSAHLADGTADLILVRKCSRLGFLRHLLRHTNKEDQFDHSFVEVYRVTRFRFQPRYPELVSLEDLSQSAKKTGFGPICAPQTPCNDSSALSSWTCDGEILPHAAIQVSVQCQLIRLFARGIEEQPPQQQQQQQQQCVSEELYSLWALEPNTKTVD